MRQCDEPYECWGAHLTGRPCTPGFTSSGSHMQVLPRMPRSWSAGACKPGSRIAWLPARRVPQLTRAIAVVGFGWRVVNHTKRCHGPRLIIFKGEPPLGVEWAPTPPEWIGVDAQGLIIVRLVSKNGTLCPEQKAPSRCSLPSPGHVPFALSNLPLLGVAFLAESVPDGFTSGKRHRDDSSSSGSVSGDGSTTNASYDGGHVVSSSAPLAYVGAAPVAPSLHIAPTSVASAVAPSANPIAIATAIDCSVAPSPLAVATSGWSPPRPPSFLARMPSGTPLGNSIGWCVRGSPTIRVLRAGGARRGRRCSGHQRRWRARRWDTPRKPSCCGRSRPRPLALGHRDHCRVPARSQPVAPPRAATRGDTHRLSLRARNRRASRHCSMTPCRQRWRRA